MATTILLVEDNDMTRDMLTRRLRRYSYDVAATGDGLEALAVAATVKPQIILLDMNLPGMDGWTIARTLKEDPSMRHIPVVALTAHAMLGDRGRALEAGCDEYLTKPVDFRLLLNVIDTLVARRDPAK